MVALHEKQLRASEEKLAYTYVESPVGRLLLAGDDRGLWILGFADGRDPVRPADAWREARGPLAEAARQLDVYFRRELRAFDLALHPVGSEFQLSVWNALPTIPYGETLSYGELARRVGRPAAVRAVGAANGANPIAIVLPCHRVIGSDGKLVGYGGGLPNKVKLLALERGDLFV
ncbi:MAG TPA: methylated-DNA--[protein]-cysteine S-methyltransferase [Spirochaetia bacterium]|nr:methylated-DNA--[protein]-cysteine S-methyltransferase [Spirochaetia bacterium]